MEAMRVNDRVAALRINGSGQLFQFTCTIERDFEKWVKSERDFDQKSTIGEGRSGIHVREAVDGVKSGDPERQIPALLQLRNSYDFEDTSINAEIVPVLVNCLAREDFPHLQYVAAWMLRFLAKEDIAVLIENDAVPGFHRLLTSGDERVQEQALLTVGILADYALERCDDKAVHDRTINNLLPFLRRPKAPFHLFWMALNTMVCIIHDRPIRETIFVLPTLKEHLEIGEDLQVQILACQAFSRFSEGGEGVQEIIEAEICPRLLELLYHHPPLSILLPVMETVANIAEYGDYREVINDKELSCILSILSRDDTLSEIQFHTWRLIGSITTGTHNDIELIIKTDLIPPVVWFLIVDEKYSLKEDAVFSICNAISGGTEEQVEYFVDVGCLNLLCNLITPRDVSLIGVCLLALERMLFLAIGNKKHTHILANTDIVLNISKPNDFEGGENNHIFTRGRRIINCICR